MTISASPSSVRVGFSSTISWSSTNATACNGTNGTVGWPGYQDTSGAFNSGSLTSTTTFTLTCTGTGGSIAGSVTVTALPVAAPL